MIFLKHTKKYYLKKILKKELTNIEVANIYNTSVENVDSAYLEYYKSLNPFMKQSFENKNAIIQAIISIISVLLVLFTLFEMQSARNAAYKPDVLFSSSTEVALMWDSNGASLNIDKKEKDNISKILNKDTVINNTPQLKIRNIGVGTAKDITFHWHHKKNIEQLIALLEPFNDIEVILYKDMVNIKKQGISTITGLSETYPHAFLLNSTEEFLTMPFPFSYFELLREIYIRKLTPEVIPEMVLDVSYSDIQGKKYSERIVFRVQLCLYTQNADGSGHFIFNLVSKKEGSSMVFLKNTISNEDILGICAIVISLISLVFSLIFSRLQIKHNKNSVKPISAIRLNDYENQISVRIDNVGTGPLIINKLYFKDDTSTSSSLISMMPEIDQFWSTFTEEVDGWAIPINGKITLLEICPKNNSIKKNIRNVLSKITVFLEYSDIYQTKFSDKKTLDFFGRHTKADALSVGYDEPR